MKIPLFKIFHDEDDIEAITNIIKRESFWSSGKEIKEFERLIAEYIGVKYCITFNSGGSALFALMKAYELNENDEVIVPSFTFIATALAPLYVNAKPIFADIEKESLGLDPEDIVKKITKNTKAIITVHYGGIPCKIKEIKEICEKYNLILIEDAAEAFGAKVNNKMIGTFGNAAIFSFCQNKIFSTGEGGCVVTNDRKLYEKLKLIRSYGRTSLGNYFEKETDVDYVDIGYNLRLSTIQAALGISQLKKVDKLISMRRKVAHYYNEKLKDIKGVKVLRERENCFNVYQLYSILVENKKTRDKLMKYLEKKQIASKVYFHPCHKYSVFKKLGYDKIHLPVTEGISGKILSLPIYPHMTKKEQDYVINAIKEFMEGEYGK